MNMQETTIKQQALDLTVEVTDLCDLIKGRSVYKNQLMRSCSSVGANLYEAKYAQSRADFINKMEVALKECYESEYWMEVLYRTGALTEAQFRDVFCKCGTIRHRIIASITTAKKNESTH